MKKQRPLDILIVDSEEQGRRLFSNAAKRDARFKVTALKDCYTAILSYDYFDYLLVIANGDISPESKGSIGLIKHIRETHSVIPVFLYSSNLTEQLAKEATEAGANKLYQTPIDAKEVLNDGYIAILQYSKWQQQALGSLLGAVEEAKKRY